MASDAFSKAVLKEMLEALISELHDETDVPKVHLYTNNHDANPSSVLGDFEAATGDWYAPIDAPIGEVYAGSESWILSCQSVQFNHDGTSDPIDIQGYYVTDDAGTKLLFARKYLDAVHMESAEDSLVVQPPTVEIPFVAQS